MERLKLYGAFNQRSQCNSGGHYIHNGIGSYEKAILSEREDIDSEGKIVLFKNTVESVNSRSQIAGIILLIKGILLEFRYIGFKEEKEGE